MKKSRFSESQIISFGLCFPHLRIQPKKRFVREKHELLAEHVTLSGADY